VIVCWAAALPRLLEERTRCEPSELGALSGQMSLIGVASLRGKPREATVITMAQLAQSQESLEAQDSVQPLRPKAEGGDEATA
jgi:hypothetical protein